MKIHFFLVLLYTLIGVVFSSSSYSKNTDFNYNAKNLSGYFSALISFNDFDYLKSKEFFKKIKVVLEEYGNLILFTIFLVL